MTNLTDAETPGLLDLAREQGRLSGEVRVLKWVVGAAFVALLAAFGAIYAEMNQGFRDVNQQFRDVNGQFQDVNRQFQDVNRQFQDVNRQFQDVNGRFDQLAYGVSDVRERLARVEAHISAPGSARTPQAPESPP